MKLEMTQAEKDLAGFDFQSLNMQVETAKANIARAETVADIKAEICNVWSKVKPYFKYLEVIPFVGKFASLLADLLNTLCG